MTRQHSTTRPSSGRARGGAHRSYEQVGWPLVVDMRSCCPWCCLACFALSKAGTGDACQAEGASLLPWPQAPRHTLCLPLCAAA